MILCSKEASIKSIKENGLPNVFIRILNEEPLPNNQDIILGIPEELYLSDPHVQHSLIPEEYVPICDDDNFDRIYCVNRKTSHIHIVYVEGGEGREYSSINEFIAWIIKEAWKLEWDHELPEFAKTFDFKFLHEAIDIPEMNVSLSSIEQDQACGQWAKSLK